MIFQNQRSWAKNGSHGIFLLFWDFPLFRVYIVNQQITIWNPLTRGEVIQMPGGNCGNYVSEIVQDSIGLMWITSSKGLYR